MKRSSPTPADLRRLHHARAVARAEVAGAEARLAEAREAAFRRELYATLRCASLFLVDLLAREGLTLDGVIAEIQPANGWPARPRLSIVPIYWDASARTLRHAVAASALGIVRIGPQPFHGLDLRLADGGRARVRIAAHSLEVTASIGTATFETSFGIVRITCPGRLSAVDAAAVVGGPLDDVLAHPATSGRDWSIRAVETTVRGTTLVVEAGSVFWRVA